MTTRDATVLDAFVRTNPDGSASLNCTVDGMRCGACALSIEHAISNINGVLQARVNATTHRLRLVWNPETVHPKRLLDAVTELGFEAHPFAMEGKQTTEQNLLVPLAVAGFGTMNIMAISFAVWSGLVTDMGVGTRTFLHALSAVIALPVTLYAGAVFYVPAARALRAGRMTMDVAISFAVLTTLAASLYETIRHGAHIYFDAAVSLVFFLLIGRVLDQALRRRASNASENLRALGQTSAIRLTDDGKSEHVTVDALVSGETILTPPGTRIAADGVLRSESTLVDESFLTGETLPRLVETGARVTAGSLVVDIAARIEVTTAGTATRLQDIADMLSAAEAAKGEDQRLADRFTRAYGPFVIGAALAGFMFWYTIAGVSLSEAIMIAVAVMIVTCPCAAGLATPAVLSRAINMLMARGVIVKNGDALERLGAISIAAIDKTGTLSNARLSPDSRIEPTVLRAASELAANSTHPLAKALVHAYPAGVRPDVKEQVGRGLAASDESRLGSAKFVGVETDDTPSGPHLWYRSAEGVATQITFRDEAHPDAHQVVAGLVARQIKPVLISGDHPEVVEGFARDLGIPDWFGALSPEAKISFVKSCPHKTLMVGDGLNDAPALGAAHASVSPGSSTDVAQNAADILMTGRSLLPLLGAIDIARQSRQLIKQNLYFAAFYNVVTIPVALAGGLTPLVAALLMSSSSILVMLNARRLGTSS